MHGRQVPGDGFDDGGDAPHEHAGVPEIAAAQVGLGPGLVGLLMEGLDAPEFIAGRRIDRLVRRDVAEAGFRIAGPDADRHQQVGMLEAAGACKAQGFNEALGRSDQVIGWQHGHDGLGVVKRDAAGREGDAGRGIATAGLGHNVSRRQLGQIEPDLGDDRLRGDHVDILGLGQFAGPQEGLAQQGRLAVELEQLLGLVLARKGPETLAASARHDQYMKSHSLSLIIEWFK
ncbi:MAG: hypothetical protein BWY87_00380 [Deltaproteobacteria bacterium ADurb.Bin510]|nr:MAG: hypothetical protein BWY87_00380 [Deltaproteobacteria bacterium ADurb.Bin510]